MTAKSQHFTFPALVLLLALASCGEETPPTQTQVILQPVPRAAPAPVQQDFSKWVADFKREALGKGISQPVLDNAFANVTGPSEKVLDRDHTQPEKTRSFEEYAEGFLKQHKIDAAREQWQSHADILAQVEEAYGVPAPILLALWQTESNFGAIQGNFSVIESLATLAYDGRRSAFFREQLFDALVIMQQEHMNAADMTGSWAGAMGQTQFIPSSFLSFAVDFDGDGKKDIWNDDADALASMANYLQTRGWDKSMGWGFRVRVPEGADAEAWAQDKEWLTLKGWSKRGVRKANGVKLTQSSREMRLVIPDGDTENAFLVTANYDVIMDWNHSTYFATGIGLLADAIGKGER